MAIEPFPYRAHSNLGSYSLYKTNQGLLPTGEAIDEQLERLGVKPSDLDLVLLPHLDCDHANGLKLVADAKESLANHDTSVVPRTIEL